MTQTDKRAACVAALLAILAFSVPASRDFLIELAQFLGTLVLFGVLIIWNVIVDLWEAMM